jgi:hypothetical protein
MGKISKAQSPSGVINWDIFSTAIGTPRGCPIDSLFFVSTQGDKISLEVQWMPNGLYKLVRSKNYVNIGGTPLVTKQLGSIENLTLPAALKIIVEEMENGIRYL